MTQEQLQFEDIAPYPDSVFHEKMQHLVKEPGFEHAVRWVLPNVDYDEMCHDLLQVHDKDTFQRKIMWPFLEMLASKTTSGITVDGLERVDKTKAYTFITNHRDIVLDSALLDKMLIDSGFTTTCEIAIGDNLLAAPWIKDLVRVNKSFIVKRGAGIKEMLVNSRQLSEYMHFVISRKNDNIWIAQREGRAKDSDDRTQQSILKMMAMGGEGSVIERLRQLHIVPLAISYEYDPCDYLKAREFQLKRDVEGWKKTKADDVLSMQTGITGRKGRIHYHCAPCIDEWLDTLDPDMPKGELFASVAEHMDREIHAGYRLYPGNYIAADLSRGDRTFADRYTEEDKKSFEKYIAGRMALIDLPVKDEPFLHERLLTMYANPAINHEAAVR